MNTSWMWLAAWSMTPRSHAPSNIGSTWPRSPSTDKSFPSVTQSYCQRYTRLTGRCGSRSVWEQRERGGGREREQQIQTTVLLTLKATQKKNPVIIQCMHCVILLEWLWHYYRTSQGSVHPGGDSANSFTIRGEPSLESQLIYLVQQVRDCQGNSGNK